MKISRLLLILFFVGLTSYAQKINKIEPPNWWVGMEYNQIEILVNGNKIAQYAPSINNSKITLKGVKRTENENYLFLTVDVSNAEVGTF